MASDWRSLQIIGNNMEEHRVAPPPPHPHTEPRWGYQGCSSFRIAELPLEKQERLIWFVNSVTQEVVFEGKAPAGSDATCWRPASHAVQSG